jgi:hypothetical protein
MPTVPTVMIQISFSGQAEKKYARKKGLLYPRQTRGRIQTLGRVARW